MRSFTSGQSKDAFARRPSSAPALMVRKHQRNQGGFLCACTVNTEVVDLTTPLKAGKALYSKAATLHAL